MRSECVRLHTEFFECGGIGGRIAIVAHAGDVVAAIQIKGNRSVAGVERAVDLHVRGRQAHGHVGSAAGIRGGAIAVGHDARRECQFGVGVTIDQGQALNLIRFDNSSQLSGGGIDHRRGIRDRHGFGRRTDRQSNIERQRLVDGEVEVLLEEVLERGGIRRDGVFADRKIVDAVLAGAVRRRRPGEAASDVGRFQCGFADDRAGLVLDCADN